MWVRLRASAGSISRPSSILTQGGLCQTVRSQECARSSRLLNDRVLPFFEEHEVALLRILTDRGPSTAANANIMSTSYISRWRTSITARRAPNRRRPMASANAFTAPCGMSSIALPLFTKKHCNPTDLLEGRPLLVRQAL